MKPQVQRRKTIRALCGLHKVDISKAPEFPHFTLWVMTITEEKETGAEAAPKLASRPVKSSPFMGEESE